MKLTPIAKKIQVILIENPEGLTTAELTNCLQKINSHLKLEQIEKSMGDYSNLFIYLNDKWRCKTIIENEVITKEVMNKLETSINKRDYSPKKSISSEFVKVQEEIEKRLIYHLIGPKEDREILYERPNVYYIGGMLYPANVEFDILEDSFEIDSDEKENEVKDDNEYELEKNKDDEKEFEEETQVKRYFPSSIGLSCNLSSEAQSLLISCRYGKYFETKDEKGKKAFLREPQILSEIILISENKGEFEKDNTQCKWFIRNNVSGKSLTIFFINRFLNSQDVPIEHIIFQPEITVESTIGSTLMPFVKRNLEINNLIDDPDLEAFGLLYQNIAEFAVGHGCAVDWREKNFSNENASQIKTVLMPSYEVTAVEHLELPELLGLDMKVLAYIEQHMIYEVLHPLIERYNIWIEEKQSKVLLPKYKEQQIKHMDRCKEASLRIKEGIEILSIDKETFEAFKFANESMLFQRSYSQSAAQYRKDLLRKQVPELQGKWRPFQLAFILMNIKSFTSPDVPERDWAELLWFPTGGGKTEAYLGLAAFVMALRRIRGVDQGIHMYAGTTVLMRYTLRLLTIQQFQRASSLICAAEYLRSKNPLKWGEVRFTIGLWVGGGTTPNRFNEAVEILNDLKQNKRVYEGNPIQLHHCPWCGEELTPHDYYADEKVFRIVCSNNGCHFHDTGIPAYTVDDAIYYQCPSILIGTVDKFARLPWKGNIASMFGGVDRYCPRHGFIRKGDDHHKSHLASNGFPKSVTVEIPALLPPELIIQDELHLISGPLGSMIGLYETAVDYLSTRNDIRPKVVASTATIRRSQEQVKGIFNRNTKQFPPSGIDSNDSFFSYEVSKQEKSGRTYVGLNFPGISGKTALVRIYAALLQSVFELKSIFSEEHIDPYWTLVGYFNSLRELGGTVRLIEDDIDKRIDYLREKGKGRRYVNYTEELTSRKASTDIPKILTKLEQTVTGKHPIDVLLATNMISVGIDIDRLGLMVVTGQPKGTSEYIQATSRVGRKYPGLIFVLYNWSRPRDISHYEQFVSYHSKLYSYVEATSVTPFSYRARDKALAAVVIGMLRQLDESLFKNSHAKNLRIDNSYIKLVKSIIVERCKEIEKVDNLNIEDEIDKILNWWLNRIAEFPEILDYAKYNFTPNDKPVLLKGINQDIPLARLIPDSLRDVEAEVKVYYLEREDV